MENSPSFQVSTVLQPAIADRLQALAREPAERRIVAASPENWPALATLEPNDLALAHDGLIRLALWTASRMCATLMCARRATLLADQGGAVEIRCIVLGVASLRLHRPLSGFLLKPVEVVGQHSLHMSAAHRRSLRSAVEVRNHPSETHLALFDAFPIDEPGERASHSSGPAP